MYRAKNAAFVTQKCKLFAVKRVPRSDFFYIQCYMDKDSSLQSSFSEENRILNLKNMTTLINNICKIKQLFSGAC